MHKEIGKFLEVLVYILMYKDNDRGNSGGDVILSGYQDIPPKRCFKIVNILGDVDIGIYDYSVPYSHLCPELRTLFIINSR